MCVVTWGEKPWTENPEKREYQYMVGIDRKNMNTCMHNIYICIPGYINTICLLHLEESQKGPAVPDVLGEQLSHHIT